MSSNRQTSTEIRQGPVEIDYDAIALVVNYTVEIVEVDNNGRVLEVLSQTNKTNRIKLHVHTLEKNMATVAAEIIQSCSKFIHPSRVEEIEQLLLKLQKHVLKHGKVDESKAKEDNSRAREPREDTDRKADSKRSVRGERDRKEDADNDYKIQIPPPVELPPASMDLLDDYLELLYQVYILYYYSLIVRYVYCLFI